MLRIEELKGERSSIYEAALMERSEWLEARGIGMWKPEHLKLRGMIERYVDPAFYGAFEGGDCVGGFALIERDERYWPGRSGDAAFYLHKFVVRPAWSGRGCADGMLEWLKAFAEEKGKDFVRLDYDRTLPYHRRMYLRHGFRDAGEATTAEGKALVLGEYRVPRRR
jgi:GNAT superfamily N-acetyltransferase